MTELGKFLKKLRIDHDETQMEMAKKLGCASAFISCIERGLKNIPCEIHEKILNTYIFTEDKKEEFTKIVFRHNNRKHVDLEGLSEDDINFILDYVWERKNNIR